MENKTVTKQASLEEVVNKNSSSLKATSHYKEHQNYRNNSRLMTKEYDGDCELCGKRGHSRKTCQMPKIRCSNCGVKGHYMRFCEVTDDRERRCYVCNEIGHRGYKCPTLTKCFKCNQNGHKAYECDEFSAICYACSATGHIATSNKCPIKRKSHEGNYAKVDISNRCGWCGLTNHETDRCYYKGNSAEYGDSTIRNPVNRSLKNKGQGF